MNQTIVLVCKKLAAVCAFTANDPISAKMLLDMGATFICHMADIVMVRDGLQRIQEEFGPLGFTFCNSLDFTNGKGK